MVTELDRWRAAQQLTDQFGERAELDASCRVDQFRAEGDAEGFNFSLDIDKKVRQLQADKPNLAPSINIMGCG